LIGEAGVEAGVFEGGEDGGGLAWGDLDESAAELDFIGDGAGDFFEGLMDALDAGVAVHAVDEEFGGLHDLPPWLIIPWGGIQSMAQYPTAGKVPFN
jgi:hypothetical protein